MKLNFTISIQSTGLPNLVRGSILASSGSSPLPIAVAGDQTVIIPTKSSTNHHWTN
ncbi:hypothetical protein A2U01_0091590 [Trifolium medium]|uniref:Uncharacterized protein n=1 Tax=Trifolium medium TaxID=97028 RepID=A0A392UBV3_9FABA|nr:hypothetical protein [Trifolium medium]